MNNVEVTDRGGIAPREGTLLLGTKNNSTYTTKGFFNFKKSKNMMSAEGAAMIIASCIALAHIIKSKNKLKRFILRGHK